MVLQHTVAEQMKPSREENTHVQRESGQEESCIYILLPPVLLSLAVLHFLSFKKMLKFIALKSD